MDGTCKNFDVCCETLLTHNLTAVIAGWGDCWNEASLGRNETCNFYTIYVEKLE